VPAISTAWPPDSRSGKPALRGSRPDRWAAAGLGKGRGRTAEQAAGLTVAVSDPMAG
jgi:hypothetical protein